MKDQDLRAITLHRPKISRPRSLHGWLLHECTLIVILTLGILDDVAIDNVAARTESILEILPRCPPVQVADEAAASNAHNIVPVCIFYQGIEG